MVIERRAGVGAHRNQQSGPVRLLETRLVPLRHGFRLVARAVRNAAASFACGGRGQRRKGRDHVDSVPSHQLSRFIIHQRGMFDRMDAGKDGSFHAGRAVSMGGDSLPGLFRHVDRCGEFFRCHLRFIGRSAGSQHAARRDHLNDAGAGRDLLASDRAHLFRTCDFSSDEPRMASDHTDGEPCPDDSRPGQQSVIDRPLQGKDRVVA